MAAASVSRYYGPAAAVTAVLATAVASAEISPPAEKKFHLTPAPYLLYAAHPSMPVPPIFSSFAGCDAKKSTRPNPCSSETRSPSVVDQIVCTIHSLVSDSIKNCTRTSLDFPALSTSSLLFCSSAWSHQPNKLSPSALSANKLCYSSVIPSTFTASEHTWPSSSTTSNDNTSNDDKETKKIPKKEVTVVLLGWLGAKQKHLKKYADWYTDRGINAVTFVIPMSNMISLKAGGRAEEQIEHLVRHLLVWMNEKEDGKEKHLFFHTFSNTGWLTYGVLLERLLQEDNKLLDNVKGCVVDSAPVADPDPQVWASGFSAAFLKKRSVATRKVEVSNILEDSTNKTMEANLKADITEQALLSMLERFFSIFLRLPYVKRRLTEVVTILSEQQPKCPQLYIYSTADKVIPAKSVESFIEEQRRAGRSVKACNLLWSSHVDHFRSFPDIYSSQLNNFIHECLQQ